MRYLSPPGNLMGSEEFLCNDPVVRIYGTQYSSQRKNI